jgi:hypothetical protein
VIVYSALPYLLAAAPAVIVRLAVLSGGGTMATTRSANDPIGPERYYSDPKSRAGEELTQELDRRAVREELRHLVEERQ